MNKHEIRRKIKNLKSMLIESEKISSAELAFQRLEQTAAFLMANKILMYHSLPDELSTHNFLHKWRDRKQFYLPRVNGVHLEILPYDETRLELGSFHIEEPRGQNIANIDEIELIVVPGIAYDKNGNRLGRGKGYYDRLLSMSKATTIGIAYDFQILNDIPVDSHDISVDIVISPSHFHVIKRKSKK